MCVAHVRDPIAHCFIDRVFKSSRTRVDTPYLGTKQFHAEYIKLLPLHIFGAHVDHALKSHERTDRCRRDSMLAGACFCDDAPLAHAAGQQRLSNGVIDFVSACVQQVFTLEVDLRSAKLLRKPSCLEERRRAAREVFQQIIKFILKLRIALSLLIGALKLFERGHQRFRNIPAAPRAEPTWCLRCNLDHATSDFCSLQTAAINARSFLGSFLPFSLSTPLTTSTPKGWNVSTTSATFSAIKPPATITGTLFPASRSASAACFQSKGIPVPPLCPAT